MENHIFIWKWVVLTGFAWVVSSSREIVEGDFLPEKPMNATVIITSFDKNLHIRGSGILVSSDGLIATNFHNVKNTDRIQVTLKNGTQYVAAIESTDSCQDLALLKIKATGLDYFRVEDRKLPQIGEMVYAVGNPCSLEFSLTHGIVGGLDRRIGAIPYPQSTESFIQTDVPLNHGCSGGPLFNASGELIGMNTAIWSESGRFEGYSFAIPVSFVHHFLQKYFLKKLC